MRSRSYSYWLIHGILFGLSGCAGSQQWMSNQIENRPAAPQTAQTSYFANQAEAPGNSRYLTGGKVSLPQLAQTPVEPKVPADPLRPAKSIKSKWGQSSNNLDHPQSNITQIQPVGHRDAAEVESGTSEDATLTINGQIYRLERIEKSQLPEDEKSESEFRQQIQLVGKNAQVKAAAQTIPTPAPLPLDVTEGNQLELTGYSKTSSANYMQMNLPTALSMVGGQHPAVGFAQWRVQEAYAQLDRANVLWLPSIQPGFSFHNHDGNYQASNGAIVDVNRNSFQFGLGSGATGAGTTPRPGIVAQFHLADALFQPEIAEKTAWARGHAANGVVNEQLLRVSLAYMNLLEAEQDLRIVLESRERTLGLSKLTEDFAATGQGLQADADRLRTELQLIENRVAMAHENVDVASARLAEALSLDACQQIVPMDVTVLPIDLVSLETEKCCLISTGLSNRPELKEAQALVAAANEQYKRQKYAPFVPSVLLGFSTSGFGGGLGNSINNNDNRLDFDALLSWEVRNLGFGEGAARREQESRYQQAKFSKVRILDQVAREVSEAHSQVLHRAGRIRITQKAIESAQNSYERNLSRIRDGQGLPLEVLQSVRALEDARRAYLEAVIEYNEAQFQLQWALGWPIHAHDVT
ncbi:TolC family protein [Rubinisphaera sp.]|uniref:TolC family protein n=1 Tax=Rubinisphaera sp. TaxID=2024857 RepID=UPI0025E91C58|nr:TolC family protein [Rubinisphaera sp.]|tara:strand:- start:4835 stop:6751 length:1917 start_codon:yes stop_codon:yes gene_type:complete